MAVVDQDGGTCQLTAYYPSGVPYDLTAARATDRLHIAGRWLDHQGMNTYDNNRPFDFYKQICKVFKSKNEEKMKCVIILATFFALHIHASNELIDYKSQRIVNLYNKAIDYVIADLEISERDMYIDKELGGLCYPRFPRFSNDSIVNVLWEDEYENIGCGVKNIHFKFKRGSNNRKNTKYILVFSQIRHGLFDVEITRIGGYTNVEPIYYPIAPVQGEWHLASYLFECASSFDSFLNVYKFLNYHPKDFTEDVNTKDNSSQKIITRGIFVPDL